MDASAKLNVAKSPPARSLVRPTQAEAEAAVRTLIAWAGDDPAREGLLDTPRRVTKAYGEFFAGYEQDPKAILSKTFKEAGGYDEDVCHGGLFHSIYGTEKFQGFKLPVERREELVDLIGSRAERLAYWNCFMDRSSLDALLGQSDGPFQILHRESGERMSLTLREYEDLCCVHLYDWLEQAPRSRFGWDYRRQAYRQMAERIGAHAIETYDQVYAGEPPVAVT